MKLRNNWTSKELVGLSDGEEQDAQDEEVKWWSRLSLMHLLNFKFYLLLMRLGLPLKWSMR